MEGLESYKTSLTPPLVIEVPVPSQESERSCLCVLRVCLCVLRVSIFPLFLPFNIFFYCFWNCFDSVVLFFLLFLELFRQCGIIFFIFIV
jgi:hypothetical protein